MSKIKKAGIITGAVVGGVIGGTVSFIGKMSGKRLVDEIGESIVDSTILTGKIAGGMASGTAKVLSGAVQKKTEKICCGKDELKEAGLSVIGNVGSNIKTVAAQGGEIAEGIRTRDKKRVKRGVKKLVKIVVVGAVTVGAIQIKDEEECNECTKQKAERRRKNTLIDSIHEEDSEKNEEVAYRNLF